MQVDQAAVFDALISARIRRARRHGELDDECDASPIDRQIRDEAQADDVPISATECGKARLNPKPWDCCVYCSCAD